MAAYVCKACGDDVWAEPGREIRTSIKHGKEAGHPDRGLCLPDSPSARKARGQRPVSPPSGPSRAVRRYNRLPLQLRVLIWFFFVGLAFMASVALAGMDDEPAPGPPDNHHCFPVRC